MKASAQTVLLALLFTLFSVHAEVRINQIQFVGSHNSYKLAMPGLYQTVLGLVDADAALALDYQHMPLHDQLNLGLRKLELDVFYQPQSQSFPVGHVQVIDMNSHCPTLRTCLAQLLQWSDAHPEHAPIWIGFNAKDQQIGWLPDPAPFDVRAFAAMDAVLEEMLGSRLIRPGDVKPQGARAPNWPTLNDARGKFLLILDEGGQKREMYLEGWRQRPMFTTVGPEHPAAAVMIVNDPLRDFERIRALVRDGYMVRTRADANTVEARVNDTNRRQAAFASGAQAVSTDYYSPSNPFGNNYRVWIVGGVRCNPVAGPLVCNLESPVQ